MRKESLLPLSTLGLALLSNNAFASDAQMQSYTVKENDSFSAIVKRYAGHKKNNISFSSNEYKNALKRFKSVHPSIKNISLIYSGQSINIPFEYSSDVDDLITSYKIKYGDTLFSVIKTFFYNENPNDILNILKEIHPYQLKDENIIKANDNIYLPSVAYLKKFNYIKSSTNRKVASVDKRFDPTFKVQAQIYDLSSLEAKQYISLFKELVDAKSKYDVLRGLKNSLEVSRKNNHLFLEEHFLMLITKSLKSKGSDSYLEDIKFFFEMWKKLRKEKHFDVGREI